MTIEEKENDLIMSGRGKRLRNCAAESSLWEPEIKVSDVVIGVKKSRIECENLSIEYIDRYQGSGRNQ
jgi:hypothetical protein